MSGHSFRSLFMAASVAGAALGCYLVSLNVASERAELEKVESQIVSVERDIRVLQTEIGTRGRLAQLERWNAGFIRLSAPSADQFVEGGFQLASMVRPVTKPAVDAPVILAAAPAPTERADPRPIVNDSDDSPPPIVRRPVDSTGELLYTASYKVPAKARVTATPKAPVVPEAKRATPPKPLTIKKTVTASPAKTAATDALAPLPRKPATATAAAPKATAMTTSATSKEIDKAQ